MSTNSLIGFVSGRLAEKGVTKAELAKLLGIKSTQTLNTKLTGASELSLSEAVGLADFCNVSVEDICKLAASA